MNSEDEIKRQFQSKFNDLKMPVPADGWTRLEESLNNFAISRKMMVRRRWQYASSAAAILLLIVGSLIYLNKSMVVDETPLLTDITTTANEVETVTEATQQLDSRVVESTSLVKRKEDISFAVQQSDPIVMMANYIQQKNQQRYAEARGINPNFIASYEDYVVETTDSKVDYSFTEEMLIIEGANILLYADNKLADDKNDYILSFVGKGGLTSYSQVVNSPMTLRSAALVEENILAEQSDMALFQSTASSNNSFEIEHNQPVSFGITVSKSLFDDLYIETGLIYSYLYSKRKNTSSNILVERKQQFHYLGIPLNINYNLFSLQKLNVYASVGGMIEKDIYGRLFQEKNESQFIIEDETSEGLGNERISQRNSQLSVNAGIGLSYPLHQNFNLYGKIGGAYYFDADNQYPTIYSDSKIVMDLNIGLRYEF